MRCSSEQMCRRLDGPLLGPQLHPIKPNHYEWRHRSVPIYNRGLEAGRATLRSPHDLHARFTQI